ASPLSTFSLVLNFLPSTETVMDEGRLGAAKRGSRRIRKVTHILNEIVKNKQ
ncbi:hypothetical protein BgiMline_020080, partial [Biomphalaria glabrata]